MKGTAQGNENRLQKQMINGAYKDFLGAKKKLLHGSPKSGPMNLPTKW